jgi:ribonuclease HI
MSIPGQPPSWSFMSSTCIRIYTDGSCSPNPGPGGWAAVLLFEGGERVVEISGEEEDSTNNRMELMAALQALQSLNDNCEVEVFTDSKYLQKGITSWIASWRKNGWLTQERQPVKNRDLWESLSAELTRHTIQWQWVKGHGDDKWNTRADELAASARGKADISVSDPDAVQIYLGVTWKHTSGTGSWAAILCYREHLRIIGCGASDTTANRLYLVAAIESIKTLKRAVPVEIFTKSGYFRDGMENWLEGWKKRDWRTREDREVSNKRQWQELDKLQDKFSLTVMSVSGESPLCRMLEVKELAREFEILSSEQG